LTGDRGAVILERVPRTANPEIRRRLLAAGQDLMYAQGFAATGVQDFTAAAGVPKGSFYNYFDTKEQYASEVVAAYWADIEAGYGPILRDPELEPLARVTRYFRALADDHARRGFTVGCLIGNLTLELAATSEPTRATLRQLLTRWENALAECLREAQRRGQLAAGRDVTELAALLIEAWEGAAMRGKLDRSATAYQRFEQVTVPRLLAG
jgi:TetR/AcrR family transcriptional regulator, transcriptional repressor for nem operon